MNKDTFYFSHDYNSRTDPKIKKLLSKHGYCGYGIFWAIIEDLYNNANVLQTDCDGIAYDLRVDSDIIKSVINDFDLFVIEGDFFKSKSIEYRINERNIKSIKARESAFKRWGEKSINANALRTDCDSNAIKERKGKEIKEKEIIKRKKDFDFQKRQSDFYELLKTFLPIHEKDILRKFYDYWREPNKSKTKMKWEQEKTWDINLRLQRWDSNKFNKQINGFEKNTSPPLKNAHDV